MTMCLGTVPAGSTLYVPFTTYDGGDGSSVTCTGLAVTDIEIYKNGSTTQRASDAGYALLDTDGIDFDSITGLHGFSIDLNDNTDAGFFAVGSWYWVVVSAITVDSQTVTFLAAIFRIGPAEVLAGYPVVDAGAISGDTTAANNAESFFDGTGYAGTNNVIPTVTTLTGHTAQTGDAFARLGAPAGASVSADVAAIKAETASIVDDTGTAGVVVASGSKTGYSLTATTGLGNQTANITGNLSGSVGSVTGAVGSVTGAVGSVTGNVGGNVAGSVASVTAGVSLADDAITAAKFDESTAFPLKSADTGATAVARTGADSDTLETLSDEIAAVKSETAAIVLDTGTDGVVLAADAITSAKIADNAIAAEHIAANAIDFATFAADCKTGSGLKANVESISANAITATAINTGAITNAKFAAGAIDAAAIANGAIDAATFAADVDAEIATMVWNAATASYGSAGSYGEALEAVGAAADPWLTNLPGAYGVGTAGYIIGTGSTLTAGDIADAVWDEAQSGHVGAGTFGEVATEVASILDDTGSAGVVVAAGSKTGYTLTATTGLGNQTANITGNLSGSVGSVTGAVGSVTGAVGSVTGSVGSVTGAVGSVTGAVGSVTGNVGGNVVGSVGSVTGHTPQTGDSYAVVSHVTYGNSAINTKLGTPAGASIAADLLVIDNFVDGLETTIGVAGAGLTALASAANLATAYTLLTYLAPPLIGTIDDAGTGTETYVYGGVTVTYTVDEDGNRASVVVS